MTEGHSSDAKMERLLNLVLALLASNRFLTKSEITSSVPGYQGSAETRDRMFERDKDELRRIGIEITVKSIDPLFEDEVGYRIDSKEYEIQLGSLSANEGVIATYALKLASRAFQSVGTKNLIFRFGALFEEDESEVARLISETALDEFDFSAAYSQLLLAIRARKVVKFEYIRDSDGERRCRTVEPHGLFLRDEEWLLRAWDRDRAAHRTFLLGNISGEVAIGDEHFDDSKETEARPIASPLRLLCQTTVDRSGMMTQEGGTIVASKGEELEVRFDTFNLDRDLRILLSIDPKIKVIEPDHCAEELEIIRRRIRDAIR